MINTNKQTINVVTLKITSAVDCVSPLCEAIKALCLYATGSEAYALDVHRAVVEALNNVILHAYSNQDGHDIIVQWSQEKDSLRIDITDYGLSMKTLPVPVLPEFDAESGRGWWIISSCLDEYYYKVVEYRQTNKFYKPNSDNEYSEEFMLKSHRNILTLIKHFQAAS